MIRERITKLLKEYRGLLAALALSLATVGVVFYSVRPGESAAAAPIRLTSPSPTSVASDIASSVDKLAELQARLFAEVEARKKLDEQVAELVKAVTLREDQVRAIREGVDRVEKLAQAIDGRASAPDTLFKPITPATGSPQVAASPALLAINTATSEQLQTLPNVGPSLASKILAYRDAHGGFKNIEELKEVAGIGDAIFAKLKGLIILN